MTAKATRLALSLAQAMTTPIGISFLDCSLDGTRTHAVNAGHRGTRERSACGARILTDRSLGSFRGNFCDDELQWLLPKLIGATGNSPWVPSESLTPIYACVDKVVARYLYPGLIIGSMQMSSQEASLIDWTFNLVGGPESEYVSAFPTAVIPCGISMAHSDLKFFYDDVEYPSKSLQLNVDNRVNDTNYESSVSPQDMDAQDLIVTLNVTQKFKAANKDLNRAAIAGAPARIEISDGLHIWGIHFANLKIPDSKRAIPQEGQLNQTLQMEAYRTNGTAATDRQIRITRTAV